MLFLQLAPVVLSLVVLAAHFLRWGQTPLMIVSLALIALLAVPRRWAARTVQAALLLGAVFWVRTLVLMTRMRTEHGGPVVRMAVILGSVAAFTAASALVFRSRRARGRFRLNGAGEPR